MAREIEAKGQDAPKSGWSSGDSFATLPPQLACILYVPDPRQYGRRFNVKF